MSLTDKDITIGRRNNNNIIIEDNLSSISGNHAILKYYKEKGVSIINKGMAGSLILIKDNIKLKIGEKIYLQNMNTNIKAEVIENKENQEEEEEDNNDDDDNHDYGDEGKNDNSNNTDAND